MLDLRLYHCQIVFIFPSSFPSPPPPFVVVAVKRKDSKAVDIPLSPSVFLINLPSDCLLPPWLAQGPFQCTCMSGYKDPVGPNPATTTSPMAIEDIESFLSRSSCERSRAELITNFHQPCSRAESFERKMGVWPQQPLPCPKHTNGHGEGSVMG